MKKTPIEMLAHLTHVYGSQNSASKKIGVSRQSVTYYFKGKVKIPNYVTKRIKNLYNQVSQGYQSEKIIRYLETKSQSLIRLKCAGSTVAFFLNDHAILVKPQATTLKELSQRLNNIHSVFTVNEAMAAVQKIKALNEKEKDDLL